MRCHVSTCARIVVLDRGRVAETGRHDELLAKQGIYAALWREQERAKGWRLGASSRDRPAEP